MSAPAAFTGTFSDFRLIKGRKGRTVQDRLERGFIPVPFCGCWIWEGARRSRRYGIIKVRGKAEAAHRISWMVYRGDIPDGMHVLHHCDTPLCVNPDHLFLGTHQDNMDDKERKGRGNRATGLRNGRYTKPERTCRGDNHPARRILGLRAGERNGRAKLTRDHILAIRASDLSSRKLAQAYEVSKTTIGKIRKGKLWGHI